MKRTIQSIIAIISVVILTGCEGELVNLTPEQLPKNPSGIYSLSLKAMPMNSNIEKSSFKPYVVINGQKHLMKKSGAPNTYEFDYTMPVGANRARYYYEVTYQVKDRLDEKVYTKQTNLFDLNLVNRFVSAIQNDRGIVGSEIPVIGRGFTEFDVITVGDVKTETKFVNSSILSFKVPALEGNKLYDVKLDNGFGTIVIGEFRVDPSQLRVNKPRIDVKSGEQTMLVFYVDNPAPKDGLELDVTTDTPECVIMPEVKIPGASKTISVIVEGGEPGEGKIFIHAPGYDEISIPIHVASNSRKVAKK